MSLISLLLLYSYLTIDTIEMVAGPLVTKAQKLSPLRWLSSADAQNEACLPLFLFRVGGIQTG